MKSLFQKLMARGRSVRDKVEQYQEAITFAEAGEAPSGVAADEAVQMEEHAGQLLVIGNGSAFSGRIIDYALEMAHRMAYDILALNIAPVPEETFAFLSPSRAQIKAFEEQSRQNVQSFQEAAQKKGIAFNHTVKCGETDAIIDQLAKAYGNIEFVVSEPENEQAAVRPEKEKRPEKQLHVYSMV